MAKKKAAKKLVKAKKVAKKAGVGAKTLTPTLVIEIRSDCSLSNNQNLNPPHLSVSGDGGFPHQVKFKADTDVWVCPPTGVFESVSNQIHITAGHSAGPYKVKTTTPPGTKSFTHNCEKPCEKFGGSGDSIIIDN